MSRDSNGGSVMLAFMLGAMAGAAVALLYAPAAGAVGLVSGKMAHRFGPLLGAAAGSRCRFGPLLVPGGRRFAGTSPGIYRCVVRCQGISSCCFCARKRRGVRVCVLRVMNVASVLASLAAGLVDFLRIRTR